jgi:molybdopterin-dependent oxidoreductase alpha subunit
MNNKQGFDCPGCAWPEPDHRARFEFCENGAKALMSATTTKKLDANFWRENPIGKLSSLSEYELENLGRIVTPAVRFEQSEYFQNISYEEACKLAGTKFKELTNPHEAVFYTSGRASNEAAFLFQLMARALGTNNLSDCSNLCHESSGVALKNTLGTGKGTVQIKDFLASQVIFLIGHNPSTNHPRMLSTLKEARLKGAKIIVINPMVEPGLLRFRHPQDLGDMLGGAKEIATHYFQVSIGGDQSLFYALLYKLFLDKNFTKFIERDFITNHTQGFESLSQSLELLDYNKLCENSGLTPSDIDTILKIICENERVIYAWGMGITQTTYGVATIEAIVNLALTRAHVGKLGAGLCPVRGHSNVQGNRTVGITHAPNQQFIAKLEERFALKIPTDAGLDVVDSIRAMLENKIKIFVALGGNLLSASPDFLKTQEALSRCELKINLATKLNKTHLVKNGITLLLPCLTRVEKDIQKDQEQIISVENSMSIVHASRGHFEPLDKNLWSETQIIGHLAHHSFKNHENINWLELACRYELIRDHIAFCIPELADYNSRLQIPGGFVLENLAHKRIWQTPSKKAQFAALTMPTPNYQNHDLLLTTIRSHDQFNTAIFGLNDRYRGIKNQRDVVFMNQKDINRLKLEHNMRVDLISRYDSQERIAFNFQVKVFDIKEGCAAAYFPEANILVPLDSVALRSNTPTSKLVPIWIRIGQNSHKK